MPKKGSYWWNSVYATWEYFYRGIEEGFYTFNDLINFLNDNMEYFEYLVPMFIEKGEEKEYEYLCNMIEEAKKRAAALKAKSLATMATSAPTGNINGLALAVPVNGSISSRFGSRGGSRSSVHTGLDISTSSGTGIRPVAAGTVTYAGYRGSYGNLLIIDHGNGVQSYYAHCSALYVSAGQTVGAGTVIGAVGSTGNSTGPHLHLEIRINGSPVNPQNYIY